MVLWAAIIFAFSSIQSDRVTIDIPGIDKLFHAIEYFILGALLVRAISNSVAKPNYKYILIIAMIALTIYGASDEFHQRFVPGRSCDIFDLFSDIIGSFLGAALMSYKERISRAVN